MAATKTNKNSFQTVFDEPGGTEGGTRGAEEQWSSRIGQDTPQCCHCPSDEMAEMEENGEPSSFRFCPSLPPAIMNVNFAVSC